MNNKGTLITKWSFFNYMYICSGPEGAKYFSPVDRGKFFFGTIVLWSEFSDINTALAKRIFSLLYGNIYLTLAGQ